MQMCAIRALFAEVPEVAPYIANTGWLKFGKKAA
jgi:hypothetical protein